ncbi:MAG: Flp family type IVb pilin [Propionicimonas sp.]
MRTSTSAPGAFPFLPEDHVGSPQSAEGPSGRTAAGTTQEVGATAVEYALIAALIAAVIAASVAIFGGQVNGLFESFQLP